MWSVIPQTERGGGNGRKRDRVKQRAVVFSLKEAVILGELVCCSATDVCLNKDE